MRDDDLVVLGVAARGHEGAAMLGHRRWRSLYSVSLVILRNVIAPFQRRVHGDHVPQVQLHALGARSIRNALQLLAILVFNARPHHLLRRRAEELPVLLVVVGQLQLEHLERVVNLRRQQVSVLVAHLPRSSLQVNVGPTVLGRLAISALQRCRVRGRSRLRYQRGKRHGRGHQHHGAHRSPEPASESLSHRRTSTQNARIIASAAPPWRESIHGRSALPEC